MLFNDSLSTIYAANNKKWENVNGYATGKNLEGYSRE